MISSKLSKFLTTPSRVASILDWKQNWCALMSIDINSERIGVAIAQHPSKSNATYKLDPISFKRHVARSKKIDDDIVSKLERLAQDYNVCGFVVSWPLQPDGRMGAPCGKVLHFLDELTVRSDNFITMDRPFTLMDDRGIPRENVDMSSMQLNDPPPDEWGRSVAFSRAPPYSDDMKYMSREQCDHPTSEDSSVAANLLDTLIENNFDVYEMERISVDKNEPENKPYCLDHLDSFGSDNTCIQASLL